MKHLSERCPTCRRKLTRSNPQLRRYWALLHVVADKVKPRGQYFSADTWHLYFKTRFLGCDNAVLPSGKVISVPRSTAGLDVAEFNDYMTQVEFWANQHGAYLEYEVFA